MKTKIFTLLCWIFYVGLIYTFLNPNHEYLNYLDNARVLYLVIHLPLSVFMGLMVLLIGLGKNTVEITLKDQVESLKKNSEKFEKFLKEKKKLEKPGLFFGINRIIYWLTTLIVIVGLGDMFLGMIMLSGCIFGYILLGKVRQLMKEVEDVIRN